MTSSNESLKIFHYVLVGWLLLFWITRVNKNYPQAKRNFLNERILFVIAYYIVSHKCTVNKVIFSRKSFFKRTVIKYFFNCFNFLTAFSLVFLITPSKNTKVSNDAHISIRAILINYLHPIPKPAVCLRNCIHVLTL